MNNRKQKTHDDMTRSFRAASKITESWGAFKETDTLLYGVQVIETAFSNNDTELDALKEVISVLEEAKMDEQWALSELDAILNVSRRMIIYGERDRQR